MVSRFSVFGVPVVFFLFWLFFLFVSLYDFFFIPLRGVFWFLSLVGVIVLFFSCSRIRFSSYVLVCVAYFLLVFGVVFTNFFSTLSWYDKLLHFVNPFILSFALFDCSFYFVRSFRARLFVTFFLMVLFQSVWEICEFVVDSFFGWATRGVVLIGSGMVLSPLADTVIDMALSVLGSFLFFLLLSIRYRRFL